MILGNETYTLSLAFSEPVESPTLTIDTYNTVPELHNPSGDKMNFTADFSVDGTTQQGYRTISITAKDTNKNELLYLPVSKVSIDPATELTRGPDGKMQGIAGPELIGFKVGAGDTTPPRITLYDYGREYPVTVPNTLATAPWLVALSTPFITLSDTGSGLSIMALFNDKGKLISWDFYDGAASAEAQLYLPTDATGYALRVGDNAGNENVMYFHVDRHEPKVEFTEVKVKLSGGLYAVDVNGQATDAAAGIAVEPVVMLVNPPMEGDLGVHAGPDTYPPGPRQSAFAYTSLAAHGYTDYTFLTADKADHLGSNELWLTDAAETVKINSTSGYVEYVDGSPVVHNGVFHLPGVVSGRHVLVNSITLSYPAPPGCTITGDPEGMSATLTAGGYTPNAQEDVSSAWDNIPAVLEYPITSGEITLPAAGPFPVGDSDWRLPQYTALYITETTNNNEMTLTCSTEEGTVVSAIAPGSLVYDVNVPTAWTSIVAPRVLYQEWVTPNLNAVVKSGIVEVEVNGITKAGKVSISRVKHDPKIPNAKPGGDGYIYNVDITAEYSGAVRVTFYLNLAGLTATQRSGIAIFHNDGTGWKNQTTEVADDHITYIGRTASPFIVTLPMDDTLPPSTTLRTVGQSATVDGLTYISSTTLVELEAADTALAQADISGPATTYYMVGAEPTEACHSAPDTCSTPVYGAPFTLPEGVRSVSYWSTDIAGNAEAVRTLVLHVDGTAPGTGLFASGADVPASGEAYITTSDSVTITATDPESNGVSSGRKDIYAFIDVVPSSCGELRPVVSTAPAGSCQNYLYNGPFSLPAGGHIVYYGATDHAGNQPAQKSAQVNVAGSVYSANTVNGSPELTFKSSTGGLSATLLGAASPDWTAALAAASAQDLRAVSGLYRLGPDGACPSDSGLTFFYSTAALPSGMPEAQLAIYGRSGNGAWAKLAGLTIDAEAKRLAAPVANLASTVFAVLGPRPAVPPAVEAFSAVSETGITARWLAGDNPSDAVYTSQAASEAAFAAPVSSETAELAARFGAGGEGADLTPNTSYYFRVRAAGQFNTSDFTTLGSTWTLAFPPAGASATGVWVTSAALAWSLNGNPEATTAQLKRSSDGDAYAWVYEGAGLTFIDAGLEACSTYYYSIRNSNGAGIHTDYAAVAGFVTMGSTPSAAGGLLAEPAAGDRISLSWDPSPSQDITEYRLYYDGGTGAVNYSAPLAVLPSTDTAWTTAPLGDGLTYGFGLRSRNRCGVEESNTSLYASATALAAPAGARAAVKAPQTGKRIKGNSVTVLAELLSGEPSGVSQVLFQYSPQGAGTWTSIPAANASHPNPDLDPPYLVHWDVTALAPGPYELRAVAADSADIADPASPAIAIVVDTADCDISENAAGGGIEKEQRLNNAVTSVVQAADDGSPLLTKVVIPAGALDASTVTLTVSNAPAIKPPPPPGAEDLGVITKLELSNAQSLLSGDRTAVLTLNYRDDDGDGTVDGTAVKAASLRMFTASSVSGLWTQLLSSVDQSRRTVTGTTRHFSFFGLFAPSATDLGGARVYPNPFRPNGGNPDEGAPYAAADPATGITFDNLTEQVEIKIYSIDGQLVAKFGSAASGGKLRWDARNGDGRDVASGGYVAVITSPGRPTVTRKILIVR